MILLTDLDLVGPPVGDSNATGILGRKDREGRV